MRSQLGKSHQGTVGRKGGLIALSSEAPSLDKIRGIVAIAYRELGIEDEFLLGFEERLVEAVGVMSATKHRLDDHSIPETMNPAQNGNLEACRKPK